MPYDSAQLELREELYQDLLRFLDRDVATSGYIASYAARNLPLELLERLVDELNTLYLPPKR